MGKVVWKGNLRAAIFTIVMGGGMALVSLLLHGCATVEPASLPGKGALPLFCEVQTPYRPPVKELQLVARAPYTLDYLLQVNTYGKNICLWKEKE